MRAPRYSQRWHNRLEALGDVEESADLIHWNANEVEKNDGFRTPMQALGSPGEYYDVLRPFGVWAVISPCNFPMALAAGPSSAALVAGNCVVFKPAHIGVFTGLKLYEIYMAAGVPKDVFHYLSGRGSVIGDEIVNHPDVAGITLTGSYEVGMGIYKGFAKDYPKPVVCERAGKNPAIVTDKADLDKATDGVLRSAFGFGGQTCSACSRVYVPRSVHDEFVRLLKEREFVALERETRLVYLARPRSRRRATEQLALQLRRPGLDMVRSERAVLLITRFSKSSLTSTGAMSKCSRRCSTCCAFGSIAASTGFSRRRHAPSRQGHAVSRQSAQPRFSSGHVDPIANCSRPTRRTCLKCKKSSP